MYYLAGLKAGFKGCKGRKYRDVNGANRESSGVNRDNGTIDS
jgi:hypothetical protein